MRRFIATAVVSVIAAGTYVAMTEAPALAPNPKSKRTIVLQSSFGDVAVRAELELDPDLAVLLGIGPTSGRDGGVTVSTVLVPGVGR
jgi:hypothetical protein